MGAPMSAQPTIAVLADFIFRETVYAVLTEQIAPEALCTPGAASRTVSTLIRSLRADQARDWLTRSGIKPRRARKQWIPQLQDCVQRAVDEHVQALLGVSRPQS
jgi:hypothetical protein